MYTPTANKIEDREKIFGLIETYGFATIVTDKEGIPSASHLPVLLNAKDGEFGSLRGHMARANEQWKHFDPAKEVLCIFHGPHSYISPSWYVSKVAVPTWNYATVHVYGYPKLEEGGEFLRKIVNDTTNKYEKVMESPWTMDFPENTVDSLLKAIVGFSIAISRVEAKFKLGQNKSIEDQASMLAALETSVGSDARALAEFIKLQI